MQVATPPRLARLGRATDGSFQQKGYGLFDKTGNVWEWTQDWHAMGHEPLAAGNDPMVNSAAATGDPRDPGVGKHGIKGGSFFCAANYCSRNRPADLEAQSPDTGTSDSGTSPSASAWRPPAGPCLNHLQAQISQQRADFVVAPLDQMFMMWSAVNRLSRAGEVIGAGQRVTPLEALKAMTINGRRAVVQGLAGSGQIGGSGGARSESLEG
jgi:hypothetical protein